MALKKINISKEKKLKSYRLSSFAEDRDSGKTKLTTITKKEQAQIKAALERGRKMRKLR